MSSDDKRTKGWPIIAMSVLFAMLLLGAYVGAYFTVSYTETANGAKMRCFDGTWQVSFFKPALVIEKRCCGKLYVGYWGIAGQRVIGRVD